jgi:nucleoside-diphosphate kinase
MAVQRTLCIIKPDAVEAGHAGAILERVQREGFRILSLRQQQLSQRAAEGFYAVHRERPFFASLCAFMTSGPVVLVALERDDAVRQWREVIGATDPAKAAEGTIRKRFGSGLEQNAVHGSDSEQNGQLECGYFFAEMDLR